MKKTLLLLFTLSSFVSAFSQIDTEFWFAAPELTQQHEPDSIRFCFVTFEQPANVVVLQPGITDPNDPDYLVPIEIYIPANSYKVLYLAPYKARGIIEIPPRNILPFGIFITSDVPISAYYAQTYKNSELYTLKGRNALGTEFLVPMQNSFSNGLGGRSSIQIVATEDNTKVDIETLVATLNRPTPGTISVTLNRGDAYAVTAVNTTGSGHLHNTKITSTKPIAVNSTDDSVDRNGQQDLVGDQLVPVNLTGDSYVAIKNNGNIERIYVFALEANTDIYLNNVFKQTINPGDVLMVDLTDKATLITSGNNEKFIAFQLTSHNSEFGGTMLPKITCTGSTEIVYREAFAQPTVNILVKTAYTGYFSVNGVLNGQLKATDFTPIAADPVWSYCSKTLSSFNGTLRVRNDSVPFHAGILDSGNGTFSYGYFSDYSSTYLLPQATKACYQIGETVRLSIQNSTTFNNITWTTPDGTQIQQDELIFTATKSTAGIYQVTAIHKEGCPIDVSFDVVVHVIEPEANDALMCKGDSVELTANGYAPFEWKLGSTVVSAKQTFTAKPDRDTCYTVSNYRAGENIFFNGDFTLGNQDVLSDYTESATVTVDGTFAIAANANAVNPAFDKIYDHTTGNATSGSHMIVKCTNVVGKKLWTKNVQVDRNTKYEFSAWFITAEKGGQQAKLRFMINGKPAGSVITPPNTAPGNAATGTVPEDWERFSCVWNSGTSSNVDISIETTTGTPNGASVCIDDIYFSPLFEVIDTFCVEVKSVSKPVITGGPLVQGKAVLDAGTENGVPYTVYEWYTADSTLIGNTQKITVNKAGKYFVIVNNGFCEATDSFTVNAPVVEIIETEINGKIEICEGDAGLNIDYQITKGTPNAYSLFFEKKAQDAGFVNELETALPTGNLFVPANVKPDIYNAEIQFVDTFSNSKTDRQAIEITVKYDPDKVMTQKWNDVITLYNEHYNGGYYFTSYQWYKNGEALPGENGSYIYLNNDELDPNDRYSALLMRNDGVELFTCDFTPQRKIITKPFPTVVTTSQTITLNNTATSGTATFYSTNGLLHSMQPINQSNQDIITPHARGLFVLRVTDNDTSEQYIMYVK